MFISSLAGFPSRFRSLLTLPLIPVQRPTPDFVILSDYKELPRQTARGQHCRSVTTNVTLKDANAAVPLWRTVATVLAFLGLYFSFIYLPRAFFPARCASAYTYLPDLHIRINDRFRLGPSLFYNRVREDRLQPPKLMLYSRENRERLLFPVGL